MFVSAYNIVLNVTSYDVGGVSISATDSSDSAVPIVVEYSSSSNGDSRYMIDNSLVLSIAFSSGKIYSLTLDNVTSDHIYSHFILNSSIESNPYKYMLFDGVSVKFSGNSGNGCEELDFYHKPTLISQLPYYKLTYYDDSYRVSHYVDTLLVDDEFFDYSVEIDKFVGLMHLSHTDSKTRIELDGDVPFFIDYDYLTLSSLPHSFEIGNVILDTSIVKFTLMRDVLNIKKEFLINYTSYFGGSYVIEKNTNMVDNSLNFDYIYYNLKLESSQITVTRYINDIVDASVVLDSSYEYDGFFGELYLNVDFNNVIINIEFLTKTPFIIDYSLDGGTILYSYNIDGVSFQNTDNTFNLMRTVLADSIDLNIVYENLGDNLYYIINNSDLYVNPADDITDVPSLLVEINSQIETSISDYFNNNPVNVDNVSITSVESDVSSALTTFFPNGAYQDLSSYNTILDNIVNSINTLKTQISSLSSGGDEVDLTGITNQLQSIYNSVNDIIVPEIDLSILQSNLEIIGSNLITIDTKIDNIETTTISCENVDLSTLEQNVIDTISANTSTFISGISLNGSSGAIYKDGEVLVIEGYSRTFTVQSSQILTTMGNSADYLYLLEDETGKGIITVQDMLSRVEVI